MALETVQAVHQAETKAIQMEKEAQQKRDAILRKAEQEKLEIIDSMTKVAMATAKQDLEDAKRQSNERFESVLGRAEKEINLLKELAKSKEQSAIQLVLEEVI